MICVTARLLPAALVLLALAPPALAQSPAAAASASGDSDSYVVSDANAGTSPIAGDAVFKAFQGQEGIDRIVGDLVKLYHDDPRIKEIFAATDDDRLHRHLAEQICYVNGGPCHYTGRDMQSTHRDMGVQQADFNALVEDLQIAMDREHVPVWAQNRLLAKLAPMQRVIVARKGYRG